MHLHFDNRSSVGVCCTAYWDASFGLPRRYTIGAGHRLKDFVPLPPAQKLAMTVHGPNGFVRKERWLGFFGHEDKWTDCCTFPLWEEQIRCEDRDETMPPRSRLG